MYSSSWLSDQSLKDFLLQEPWRWSLSQAVRVLGKTGKNIEFSTDPSYQYPCGEISRIRKKRDGWQIISTLPALNGYHGILPYGYQDFEQELRLHRDDSGVYGLWNIFNDRILRQTAITITRCDLGSRYEQRYQRRGELAKTLLTISGLPEPKYIPADNLFHYAGVLARKTTSLELLATVLSDYFQIDVQLVPPPIIRMPLAADCLTRLRCGVGHHSDCVGYLGVNTIAGNSCYLLHSLVNVVINVETVEQYKAVTSDNSLPPAILEFCRIYFELNIKFRLQIRCPRCCLVSPKLSSHPGPQVARLGRLSCLIPELHPDQSVVVDFRAAET